MTGHFLHSYFINISLRSFFLTTPLAVALEGKTMKQNDIQRRLFLQALGACLASTGTTISMAATPATPTAASAASLDSFLGAASKLCDLKLDNRELAASYLDALKAQFGPGGITALTAAAALDASAFSKAIATSPLKEVSQQAMLLWLTGMTTDAAKGTQSVVSYTDAAVWQALPFTKPAAQCGGAFGYWADKPTGL
jgi:Membrane bound FAD containing D-sorbitol dehydrogenase